MLKTRITTAIVIFAVVLITLLALPAWLWALLTAVIGLGGCWEWSRLTTLPPRGKVGFLLASAAMMALAFVVYLRAPVAVFERIAMAGFIVAAGFWLLAAPLWLAKTWRPRSLLLSALVGWIVIFPTWLALVYLREGTPWLLLTFAAIVWIADIAAYFAGKAFGRHKLAPSISPGKTLEGAIGGLAGVTVYYFVWLALTRSSSVRDQAWVSMLQTPGLGLLLFFLLLTVISILGDLFESWIKRCAGMKDSSQLLPGHGGILDRIDALTSTLPIAGLYVVYTAS